VCRRLSAVVNLNCVTNRIAPRSRYKLSYDAEQYKTIHTLLNILYLQTPHLTVRHYHMLKHEHLQEDVHDLARLLCHGARPRT
jgi:hypothetical protein